jgi:peroxiredoxin
LAKIYEKANVKGVEFVGIFIKDTDLNAKEFVAQYRFTFPTGLDSEAKLATEYKVFGPPVKFFINRAGHIVERVSGPMKEADLIRSIERLIGDGHSQDSDNRR